MCSWRHVIRIEGEKVTLDIGSISSSPPSSKSSDIIVLPCKLVELFLLLVVTFFCKRLWLSICTFMCMWPIISVWYQSTVRTIREQMDPYVFEPLSRYFNVIHWSFCAAPLQVEHTYSVGKGAMLGGSIASSFSPAPKKSWSRKLWKSV